VLQGLLQNAEGLWRHGHSARVRGRVLVCGPAWGGREWRGVYDEGHRVHKGAGR